MGYYEVQESLNKSTICKLNTWSPEAKIREKQTAPIFHISTSKSTVSQTNLQYDQKFHLSKVCIL